MSLEVKFIIWLVLVLTLIFGSGHIFSKGYRKNRSRSYSIYIILLVIIISTIINIIIK